MVSLVVWGFCLLGVAILILGGRANEGASEISLLGCSLVVAASIVFACCLRWTKKVVATVSVQCFHTSISIVLAKHHHAAIYFIADGKLGYPF